MFTSRLTLTKITETFTKVVKDLEDLKAQNVADIANHQTAIDEAQAKQAELQKEHDAADRIHSNVSNLLK